jgi:hypothetical protein
MKIMERLAVMNLYDLITCAGEKAEPVCIFVYCAILPWPG